MKISQKIKTISELARTAQKLKKQGKKIVLCHGVFDLVHPGHIKHFQSAKSYGDLLIVTITADEFVRKGPGRPIFRQDLRAEFLAAIEYIDFVAINHSYSAIPAIKKIKPDFLVKGPDYKNRKINPNLPTKLSSEEAVILSVGGKLIFTDDEIFSSSKLINDYLENYPPQTRSFLETFKLKHTSEEITEMLLSVKNTRILVVGDAIIDQYHYCLPTGKSSKEPLIVQKYISEESFIGGALASANHTFSLSRNVSLLSVLGKKTSFESFIDKHLAGEIKRHFFLRDDTGTIVKRRFLDAVSKQKLFQIGYMKDDFIPPILENKILSFLKKKLTDYDLVIVNDFGHGMLTQKIIDIICRNSKQLALNVQANSSNYGFNVVTKYPKADYVCIDEQELRLATHDKYAQLEDLIKAIYEKMRCSHLMVTRGADGSIVYNQESGFCYTPSFTQRIVDRVGAGDALFSITSPLQANGLPPDVFSFVGNVAGAIQVQTIGNKKPIELVDLTKFITRLLK